MKTFIKSHKVIFIIIFSCLACISVALSIFILAGASPPSKQEFSFSAISNLSIKNNESAQIDYAIYTKGVCVSFVSADENIAKIENNSVVGVGVGKTEILVKASLNKVVKTKIVDVEVLPNVKTFTSSLKSVENLYLFDKYENLANDDNLFNNIEFSLNHEYSFSIQKPQIIKVENNRIIAKKEGESFITFICVEDPSLAISHKIVVSTFKPTLKIKETAYTVDPNEIITPEISITPAYFFGNAIVELETESALVEIDKNTQRITALSSGEATIKVILNNEEIEILKITILANYSISLTAEYNCEVVGLSSLKVINPDRRINFSIELLDHNKNKVEYVKGDLVCTNDTDSNSNDDFKLLMGGYYTVLMPKEKVYHFEITNPKYNFDIQIIFT